MDAIPCICPGGIRHPDGDTAEVDGAGTQDQILVAGTAAIASRQCS